MCRFQLDNIIGLIDRIRSNPNEITLATRNIEEYEKSKKVPTQASDEDMSIDTPLHDTPSEDLDDNDTTDESFLLIDEKNISNITKRKRYGTLFMAKRNQFQEAANSFENAAAALRSTISSNRTYLHNLHTIGQHYTIKLIPTAINTLPQIMNSNNNIRYIPPKEIKYNNWKYAQEMSLSNNISLQKQQQLQILFAGVPGKKRKRIEGEIGKEVGRNLIA